MRLQGEHETGWINFRNMGLQEEISPCRRRLDETLTSRLLLDGEALQNLINTQLLRHVKNQTEECVQSISAVRATEVANLLHMLRNKESNENGIPDVNGCPPKPHNQWKVKRNAEECRIMYREGPDASPFHTFLVEGYVDAPVDACLCVSWEAELYSKWWPRVSFPTFRLISSRSLHKFNIHEHICSMRMKLPWPLSDRKALLRFFVVEYFPEDLVIVLMKTIPEQEFGDDEEAESKDVVRVEVVGGFALQKASSNRSYFRAVANIDMKVEFVPLWLINFISRQLISNGFDLYKRTVASVVNGDDDFSKVLKGPLYARIRDLLYLNRIEREGTAI